jgi:cytochrome oxidase assembly protein ShyY1
MLRGRWLVGTIVALLFAAVFVALGLWQLGRHHHKQEVMRTRRAEYAAPAPELQGTADPAPGTRVQATGTYDGTHQILLRNQPRDDDIGTDVLTPLVLDDGTAVIVDRGWLDGTEPDVPAAPSGTVTVRGLARSPRALSAQDDEREIDGQLSLPRVDLDRIGEQVIMDLRGVWIEAQAQSPASEPPDLPDPPPPTTVNHMQYAIQWFLLALIPLVGWPIVLARRKKKVAS